MARPVEMSRFFVEPDFIAHAKLPLQLALLVIEANSVEVVVLETGEYATGVVVLMSFFVKTEPDKLILVATDDIWLRACVTPTVEPRIAEAVLTDVLVDVPELSIDDVLTVMKDGLL